ncbi:MAG: methyltransferase domain-containing protein [Acidobacteria bacterium]|nr:methyltransferase domain-containing protein [Acidobacteriota bacterium]
MNLDDLQRHWDAFGQQDPMWAILTDPARKGRRWSPAEFFATGVTEIAELMREAAVLGVPQQRRRALDFGCGLGRLTQALAAHADHVTGLDVAPSMIAQARAFNQHGARVDYHVQAAPPFAGLADRSIDLVYTGRVLQHIAPEYSRRYISELARVLAPGGFLSFDVPSRWRDAPALPAGALPAAAYRAELAVTGHEVSAGGVTVDLRVRNGSPETWPSGLPLNLGNHWLTASGAVVLADDQRLAVPLPLAPGAAVDLRFSAPVPADPAARLLEFDLVHEGVAWFAWLASPTARIDVGAPAAPPLVAPAAVPEPAPASAFEPVMERHAVPRADVEALLAAAGVRLLRVRQEQHCGPHWDAFRYDVTAG